MLKVMYKLGNYWPVTIDAPEETVAKSDEWPTLTSKMIKWIVLCEMFP